VILPVGKRDLTVVSFSILIMESPMTWSPRERGRLSSKCEAVM